MSFENRMVVHTTCSKNRIGGILTSQSTIKRQVGPRWTWPKLLIIKRKESLSSSRSCYSMCSQREKQNLSSRTGITTMYESLHRILYPKKVREKSRECHNHKPQHFPDSKRKRKPTNLNKHKPNKCTKSTKISSLFPKRGNRNTKRTEKHKNKMTHGKTYNKLPRRINHKATKSKTNTGTTALERSVEQTTGGWKHFYS